MKNKTIFLLALSVLIFSLSRHAGAQTAASVGGSWVSADIFQTNVIIENNGQLTEDANGGSGKILFSANQQGVDLFWKPAGLTYRVTEKYFAPKDIRENAREVKEGVVEREPSPRKVRYHYLNMEWLGANPSAEVSGEEKVSHYFTYADPRDESGQSGIRALAYKKICYRNIYPGIDAEYVLSAKGGIKYSLIVHPGADPSVIGMRYADADAVSLNALGEIEVVSKECGGYLEHAPATYYESGIPVNSMFKLDNGVISFSLATYDKSQTLIIDPWVSNFTSPAFVNPTTGGTFNAYKNIGYDVAYDKHDNVWVYGGGDPFFLAKYSASGTLLWVYSVPLVGEIVGDFDVNKQSGSAYVSEGWADLGARVVKVDANGMVVKTSAKNIFNEEIGRIRLDCKSNLYTTGGGAPVAYSPVQWQACSLDTNLTALTGKHITTSTNVDHDVSLMCIDPASNAMYENFNYPSPGSPDFMHNNEMHKLPLPAFMPSTWTNPGPIHNFTELVSIPYAGPCLTCFGNVPSRLNVFNGMVCGNGFLYSYDGATLKKYDKNSGAMLASVVTGGKKYWSGGIDLDLCENVYVSVSNAVKEYDASLTLVKTYPLTDTSCHDIKIDKEAFKLFATGNNYVRGIDIDPAPLMTLTTTVTPPTCTCNGTASAMMIPPPNSTPCNSNSYTYLWLPGGQTTSTISGLCAGTYTVISKTDINCAKTLGDTAIVVVPTGGGNISINFTLSDVCGKVSFVNPNTLPGATWAWSFPGGSPPGSSAQNPPVIVYPTGTYTATLIASAGTGCVDTVFHVFTIGGGPTAAFTPTAPCIGSATQLTDGSVADPNDPIASWNWSMPAGSPASSTTQNSSTIYNTGGTHTVTLIVTSQKGCKDTIDQQVLVYNPPVADFSKPDSGCAPVCVNYSDLSVSVDGTINNWQWSFPGGSPGSSSAQNPPTICYNTPGNYNVSLIVTSQYGCSDTVKMPMIKVFPWPDAEFCVAPAVAPTTNPVFNFCDMWSNDVVQWSWNFGDNDSDHVNTDPVHSYSATVLNNDFYSYQICIRVQNSHGCWDTTCKVVEIIPEFEFYIPNCFTPNSDWVNEMFYGKSRGVKKYNIWLFDRWGNQIWDCHAEDKNTNWDSDATVPKQEGLSSSCQWDGVVVSGGMDMGGNSRQLAQEDVYVWKVRLTDIFDKEHNYIGHVSIVR